MKNKKNIHTSLSSYCTEYISNFNLHQLNTSWKRNALKAAAIAATSSFVLSSTDVQAQILDCPPAFEEILPIGGPVTNPNGLSDVNDRNSTPTFVDYDGDGDFDIVTGDGLSAFATPPTGSIYLFTNIGTNAAPVWTGPTINPNGLGGNNINPSYGVLSPDFVDIDGDSDLDAFIGTEYDGILYFENTGSTTAPNYNFVGTNQFGILDRENATPDFADIDGDGDFDLFIGEYLGNTSYFRNDGTITAPNFVFVSTNPGGIVNVGNYAAPTLADLDGDGDLDMMIGDNNGDFRYYENTGSSTAFNFGAEQLNPFGLSAVADDATPDFQDIDNDGDLDMITGSDESQVYYENIGTATAPLFQKYPFGLTPLSGQYNTIDYADMDADGDIDFMVGNKAGQIQYIENVGTTTQPSFAPPTTIIQFGTGVVEQLHPTLGDIDGDGDVDIFFGTTNIPALYFIENLGTPANFDFSLTAVNANQFGVTNTGSVQTPEFVDLDNDGDLDIVAGGDLDGGFYYQNIGTPTVPNYAAPVPLSGVTGYYNRFSEFDADGDGDSDLIVGNGGDITYYQNTGTLAAPNFLNRNTSLGLINPNTTNETDFSPTIVDIDQDGMFEGFVGNKGENLYVFTDKKVIPEISIVEGASIFSCDVNTLSINSSNVALNDLTITWYDSNNNAVATGPTFTLTSLDTETYSVKAVSSTGCESNQPTVNVIKNTPVISIVEGSTVNSCEPVTLHVESSNTSLSDLTFTWYDKDNNAVATGLSYEVDPLALPQTGPKIFSVRAIGTIGCESNLATVSVSCSDEVSINLTASAGYNAANLNWTATGSRPIREYEVYGDPGQGGTYFLFGFSPTTSYGAIGLMNGQNVDFKVRAVYTDGKYSPYSNTVTVRPSVVLGEDDKNKAGFAFFPNPNSGEFNIKLQDGSASAIISVTSISGQRVYTTTLNASQSSINLGNVASGMYIILVETAQGTYQQKISIVR